MGMGGGADATDWKQWVGGSYQWAVGSDDWLLETVDKGSRGQCTRRSFMCNSVLMRIHLLEDGESAAAGNKSTWRGCQLRYMPMMSHS